MDVKLDKWHKCKVDIEVLKELSKKSDIKGFQHVSLFFGLLILTGSLAYLTWGTWWSVFWFLVYGNIYSFSNPLWHETGHKTAFQSKFLNEIFYYISSYMANFEPIRWRHTHFVHHGNTYSTENPFDHEIEYGNNLKDTPKGLIISLIPFLDLIFLIERQFYDPSHAIMDLKMNRCFHTLKTKTPTTRFPKLNMLNFQLQLTNQKKERRVENL